MSGKSKLDRQLLLEYLWRNSNRQGRLLISQKQLAIDLNISLWQMNRIIHELEERGCLTIPKRGIIIMKKPTGFEFGGPSNKFTDFGGPDGDRDWDYES